MTTYNSIMTKIEVATREDDADEVLKLIQRGINDAHSSPAKLFEDSLYCAAELGSLDCIQGLMRVWHHVPGYDTKLEEATIVAAESNQAAVLRLLSSKGVSIEAFGGKALRTAAECHSIDALRTLIACGAKVNDSEAPALCNAMRRGWVEGAQILIDAGASVKWPKVVADAARFDSPTMLALANANGADLNVDTGVALRVAASCGRTANVAYLLASCEDIHFEKDMALVLAAGNGRCETMALLIAQGANAGMRDSQALRAAATSGKTAAVEMLLANGADVHALDDMALFEAVKGEHVETVAMLISHGANPNASSGYGEDDRYIRAHAVEKNLAEIIAIFDARDRQQALLASASASASAQAVTPNRSHTSAVTHL